MGFGVGVYGEGLGFRVECLRAAGLGPSSVCPLSAKDQNKSAYGGNSQHLKGQKDARILPAMLRGGGG